MLHYIWIVAAVEVLLLGAGTQCEEFHIAEPWKTLPKLYDYDDFDDCKRENPGYLYCVVKAHIVENSSSALWQQINQYSSDPRHYRRDILELGVCLDRCRSTGNPAANNDNKTKQAEICAADRVWRNYRLNSTSHVMNCVSDEDLHEPVGFPEMLFNSIFIAILSLVVMSTVVDVKKLPLEGTTLVQSFSMSQNLRRLGSLHSRSRTDLLFLDGVRVLTMTVILLCHATIPMIRLPLKHPEKYEQQFDNFWFPIAMSGNTYTVQMFFVIGGVVLSVNFLDHIKTHPEFKLLYIWDRVLNRLIRIVPVYAFVILFQVSWYPRLKDGPIADRYKDHCIENWWTNLLFINNYINVGEPCAQFTWYLGADFQLFLIGTTVMMAIWKFPRITPFTIYAMVLFGLAVPALVIYAHNLDATVMVIVKYITAEIRNLDYYLKVYVTSESNAGNYFFGIIAGIVYHHISEHAKKLDNIKNFRSMFFVAAVFFIVMNVLTVLLPSSRHTESGFLLLAIYGSLLKSSWGILACFLILYLSLRPHSLLTSFLQHPIMLVSAKLSYCVYVVQYTVVYVVYRNVTAPLANNTFHAIFFTSAVLFVTLLVGFLLHVCVEVPFMMLLKALLGAKEQKPVSFVVDRRDDCRTLTESKTTCAGS